MVGPTTGPGSSPTSELPSKLPSELPSALPNGLPSGPARGSTRSRIVTGTRLPWLDLGLVALAVVFAFPSFWYPFGRDQAAHAYIGWGWLHGFIPFRDATDQKPPGMYLLYMFSSAVFGERQFGIRVIDLLGILLGGWLAARAVRRNARRQSGEIGAAILLIAGFYYTCFDYWNSAQTEIWQGLAVLAAVVIIREEPRARRAAFATGLLGGVAVLFKFTAAVLCLGLAAMLAVRAWQGGGSFRERGARILGWAGLQILGGVLVVALCAAYFAAHGALGDAVDMLVQYNIAYGVGWRADPVIAQSRSADFWFRNSGLWVALILAAWAWALGAAWRRRERFAWEMLLVPGGLLALGVIAVAVQGKFFAYHWGVLVPFLALAGAHGLAECGHRHPRLVPWAAAGAMLFGFLLAPEWICNRAAENPRPTTYLRQTGSTWSYILERSPRAEFLKSFDGGYGYRYADEEAIGRAIRTRARPGDRLLVRGFEPTIYTVSGLRCPSRFFIELQLQERRVTFAREAWIAEYRQAVVTDPPRFVVLGKGQADRIGDLNKHGYRRAEQSGRLVVYDRASIDGTGPTP